jgi:FAD/FMN-containing dehydrogenase
VVDTPTWGSEKCNRLVAVKDRYDPQNRFRFNHNIAPSHA